MAQGREVQRFLSKHNGKDLGRRARFKFRTMDSTPAAETKHPCCLSKSLEPLAEV